MKIQYSISLLVGLSFCFFTKTNAQELYFPEIGSDNWETIEYQELGWCQDKIDDLIDLNVNGNSKALIILKSGKIVIEEYFGDHNQTKNWYWASAAKSLTAALVGVAHEEGIININDATSEYLGDWTICNEANSNVTILNQLTMTTGLDYSQDIDCTDPVCLDCLNEVGTEWFYHNAPYTLLQDVISVASGNDFSSYTQSALRDKIGMNGFWLPVNDTNVFFSTARSMARFGLMMQANGDWGGAPVIGDKEYLNSMITSSQEINKSYGYLWWLNGQESYRLPGSTFTFSGSLIPQISAEAYMALGKNGQYIIVIPSEEIVIIRMGDDPDSSLVPLDFLRELMDLYTQLNCTTDVNGIESNLEQLKIVNSLCLDKLEVVGLKNNIRYSIVNYSGVELQKGELNSKEIDVSTLNKNLYFITFYDEVERTTQKFYKN